MTNAPWCQIIANHIQLPHVLFTFKKTPNITIINVNNKCGYRLYPPLSSKYVGIRILWLHFLCHSCPTDSLSFSNISPQSLVKESGHVQWVQRQSARRYIGKQADSGCSSILLDLNDVLVLLEVGDSHKHQILQIFFLTAFHLSIACWNVNIVGPFSTNTTKMLLK